MTPLNRNPKELFSYLDELFLRVLRKEVSIEDFCREYEDIFNFELTRDGLSLVEHEIYEKLFDTIAWFSPDPRDHAQTRRFTDEPGVLTAVELTVAELSSGRCQ
jgi:hypothetical protein